MRTDHDSAPIRPRATAVGRDERWAHRPCRASGKQRTPGRTRTRDPLLRRQPLYPSELQGRIDCFSLAIRWAKGSSLGWLKQRPSRAGSCTPFIKPRPQAASLLSLTGVYVLLGEDAVQVESADPEGPDSGHPHSFHKRKGRELALNGGAKWPGQCQGSNYQDCV